MATVEECRSALEGLAARLASVDVGARRRHSLDRSLSCQVTDLRVAFSGRLVDGTLRDLQQVADPAAKIKLATSSDDLLALTRGSLSFPRAWADGRLTIDASMFDLLKLRSLA